MCVPKFPEKCHSTRWQTPNKRLDDAIVHVWQTWSSFFCGNECSHVCACAVCIRSSQTISFPPYISSLLYVHGPSNGTQQCIVVASINCTRCPPSSRTIRCVDCCMLPGGWKCKCVRVCGCVRVSYGSSMRYAREKMETNPPRYNTHWWGASIRKQCNEIYGPKLNLFLLSGSP